MVKALDRWGSMQLSSIRQWVGLFLVFFYATVVYFCAKRVLISIHNGTDLHSQLSEFTQFLVFVSVPISLHHIWDHLAHFRKPELQAQIIRISWMVPVFCCESYLSLVFVKEATYFQAVRELYEAYILHCFMRLIMQYLAEGSGGQTTAERIAAYPASMGVHKPPFCCLAPWQMGADFVIKCKTGVFQYVVVRFFNTLLSILLFALGLYEEGKFAVSKPFLWITAVNFCSQSWALYSLFLFFLCVHKELHGMRPFSKFLCIKLIIFTSWWQALLIGILVRAGRIHHGYGHSAQEIAVFIRCTAISAEMVVAAVAFSYAFPLSELLSTASLRKTDLQSFTATGSRGVMKLLAGYHQQLPCTSVGRGGVGGGGNPAILGKKKRDGGALVAADMHSNGWLQVVAGTLQQFFGFVLRTTASDDANRPLSGGSGPTASGVEVSSSFQFDIEAPLAQDALQANRSSSCQSLDSLVVSPAVTPNIPTLKDELINTLPDAWSPRSPSVWPLLPQQLRYAAVTHADREPERPETPQLRKTLRASLSLNRREGGAGGDGVSGYDQPLSPTGNMRRQSGGGSFSFTRAPDQDFQRNASFPISEGVIQDSDSGVSDCSHDETASDTSLLGQSVPTGTSLYSAGHSIALSPLSSNTLPVPPSHRGGAAKKTRVRSGSKGHRAGSGSHTAARSSPPLLEALWISTLPSDLQGDWVDLLGQLAELLAAVHSAGAAAGALLTKRPSKGGAGAAGKYQTGKKMVV